MPILNSPDQDGGNEGYLHKKGKIQVAEILSNLGYFVEYEAKFWLLPNQKIPFRVDIYLPDHQVCIEIDGQTHESKRAKQKDAWKDSCLEDVGKRVIRMKCEDATDYPEYILTLLPSNIADLY